MEFVCKTKCRWNKTIYKVGDTIEVGKDGIQPPIHFIPVGQKLEEEVADKEKANTEIENIKKELTAMKVPFDKRWGLASLKSALITAKKTGG